MSAAREASTQSNAIPDNPIAEIVESWLINLDERHIACVICHYCYGLIIEDGARELSIGMTKYQQSLDRARMYIKGRADEAIYDNEYF